MIAVTGATGKLGHHVIEGLLKTTPASGIVALVRNPQKADAFRKQGINVRQADYDQPQNWEAALSGVKTLLLISSSEVGKRLAQHKAVLQAAKAAKVQRIAYTSILKADTSSLALAKEHLATEVAIRESGLPFTFLRNAWYFENHTEQLAPALEHGAILGAAQEGRFSSASREDYARAAAQVITASGHEGKIYELAGDSSYTLSELAAEVSRQAGKPVAYKDLGSKGYAEFLMSVGLPGAFAEILADSDIGASKGELQSSSKDLSKLIGGPTSTLQQAVAKAVRRS